MASPFGGVLARAKGFVLHPPPTEAGRAPNVYGPGGAATGRPLEVLVLGATPRCGATTVARGLALVMTATHGAPAITLDGTATVPCDAVDSVAIVRDAGCNPAAARVLAERADATVLVVAATGAPALAEAVAQRLSARLGPLSVVANRSGRDGRWEGRAAAVLPDSRVGAALLARGLRPVGALAGALEELALVVERAASA